MKKDEAERAIRHLCHVWGEEVGMPRAPDSEPNFYRFKAWLRENGHGHYLTFRSVRGADADAELWFDEEFLQTWRN